MKKQLLIALTVLGVSAGAVGFNLVADHTHDQAISEGIDVRDDHSGRTDKYGCHNDRKNGGYHCH